jgi:hypothetical protein
MLTAFARADEVIEQAGTMSAMGSFATGFARRTGPFLAH